MRVLTEVSLQGDAAFGDVGGGQQVTDALGSLSFVESGMVPTLGQNVHTVRPGRGGG